jgi:DNA-binding IclR family transcriptional regulator
VVDRLEFHKGAPNSITSKKMLFQEFEMACDQGIALEDQELMADLKGIATSVYDENTEVTAAIALITTAPMTVGELARAHIAQLQAAASQISTRPTNKRR